jgi:hypothetical protein
LPPTSSSSARSSSATTGKLSPHLKDYAEICKLYNPSAYEAFFAGSEEASNKAIFAKPQARNIIELFSRTLKPLFKELNYTGFAAFMSKLDDVLVKTISYPAITDSAAVVFQEGMADAIDSATVSMNAIRADAVFASSFCGDKLVKALAGFNTLADRCFTHNEFAESLAKTAAAGAGAGPSSLGAAASSPTGGAAASPPARGSAPKPTRKDANPPNLGRGAVTRSHDEPKQRPKMLPEGSSFFDINPERNGECVRIGTFVFPRTVLSKYCVDKCILPLIIKSSFGKAQVNDFTAYRNALCPCPTADGHSSSYDVHHKPPAIKLVDLALYVVLPPYEGWHSLDAPSQLFQLFRQPPRKH